MEPLLPMLRIEGTSAYDFLGRCVHTARMEIHLHRSVRSQESWPKIRQQFHQWNGVVPLQLETDVYAMPGDISKQHCRGM
jgi:hypothetical protein